MRKYSHLVRAYVDAEALGVLALVLNPALVILFFQSGKVTLLPPRPGVFAEALDCCSQALIFPRLQVPLIVEFLQEKNKGQVDLLLDNLADEDVSTRYALYPVQAQHIGNVYPEA